LTRYGFEASRILLLAARDARPLSFFGLLGVVCFAFGMLCGGFVLAHWAVTGQTTPYRSVLTGSAVFLLMGALILVLALLADLIGRIRRTVDFVYFYSRSHYYGEICQGRQAIGNQPGRHQAPADWLVVGPRDGQARSVSDRSHSPLDGGS
jgi:hypothetical protein